MAARNIGVTLQTEGRRTSAILWLRRAIAAGDPDARFDLAKLLLEDQDCSSEARKLLEDHIAAGPQETYELRPVGSFPRVDMDVRLEDEGFEEAKRLLAAMKDGANA
jgi:TPR repeat protein